LQPSSYTQKGRGFSNDEEEETSKKVGSHSGEEEALAHAIRWQLAEHGDNNSKNSRSDPRKAIFLGNNDGRWRLL